MYMPIGYEGQLGTQQNFKHIRGTFGELVVGGSTKIPFGRVVVADTSDVNKRVLPSGTGKTPKGVSILSETREKGPSNGTVGYEVGREIAELVVGVVYMYSETALTAGSVPYFRHTAGSGANTELGRIRSDADTNKADLFTGARVLRSCAAGSVVPVELELFGN